jgi:regulator of replication initiation timing
MAIERENIDYTNNASETLSTKLYSDTLNYGQVEKSIDTKVIELIKPLPTPNLDLVPRPIYQAEVDLNAELNQQILDLNAQVADLSQQLQQKTSDSGSLYISNDFLKLQNANLENKLEANNNIISDLRTGVATSLQKAISENAERTGLEAENAGLVAQKTALLKQIDTLNNLVSAAQASVAKTQEAVAPMNELKAAGGLAIGNLATILFDDLSNYRANGRMFEINYVKSKSNNKGELVPGRGSDSFQLAAGAKDINVTITDGDQQQNNSYIWSTGRRFDVKAATTIRGGLTGNKINPNNLQFVQYNPEITITAAASDGTTASVKINSRWFNT